MPLYSDLEVRPVTPRDGRIDKTESLGILVSHNTTISGEMQL